MLIIRKKQIDVFARGLLADFEDEIVRDLSQQYPLEVGHLPVEEIRETVHETLQGASKYKLEGRAELFQLVGELFVRKLAFAELEAMEWAPDILEDEVLATSAKVALLLDELTGLNKEEEEKRS